MRMPAIVAAGVFYIAALNLWESGARYRIQKGPRSAATEPVWWTPFWRAGRWLEPRGVRLLWLGNAAFAAGTILLVLFVYRG